MGRLQRALGNRTFGRFVQARSAIIRPEDGSEREADRVADQVVRMPDGAVPAASASRRERRTRPACSQPPEGGPGPGAGLYGIRGQGKPLSGAVREFFEPRFGADFSQVRVHTNARASAAAHAIDARAFTFGRDIFFGPGEFEPGTSAGKALLAHELTHTVQQGAVSGHGTFQRGFPTAPVHAKVIQRQARGSGATSQINARDVFPFPQGSRLLLGRILSDAFFAILSEQQPTMAAALRAIDRQRASVTTASDDLFEARIDGSVTIPAQGEQPARTLRNVTLSLRRSGGTFEFGLTAEEGERRTQTTLMSFRDLTARRGDDGVVLSSGTGPDLRPQLLVAPAESGGVQLEVFKSNFVDQIPEGLRRFVPERIEAIGISRLPDAATDAQVQRAVQAIAARQRSRRRTRRQEFSFGGGAQVAGEGIDPVLFTSWQIRFPTTGLFGPTAGQFLHVPLELQLQYAPTASVLGGVSTGATLRLPTGIPVNLRLVAGAVAGRIEAPVGEESEGRGAFGLSLGGAAGVELGRWRINLRYEHLYNVVENSPNVDSFFATGGVAF